MTETDIVTLDPDLTLCQSTKLQRLHCSLQLTLQPLQAPVWPLARLRHWLSLHPGPGQRQSASDTRTGHIPGLGPSYVTHIRRRHTEIMTRRTAEGETKDWLDQKMKLKDEVHM